MCGRYLLLNLNRETALRIMGGELPRAWQDRYNVTPGLDVLTVRLVEGRRVVTPMRWGLIPHFARGEPGKYHTINARMETLQTSPAYRTAWRRGQRCLILASAFYEWQEVAGGKQPYYIGCADQEVFAFAGLWDSSTPPDGTPVLSCTIITLPASPLMAQIHNTRQREPAILRPADHDTWLGGDAEQAWACLQPYPDELRSVWPVSKRVNNPRNDGPQLIERVG
jgi:putative SOS response-associated peptidase YedK